MAEFRQRRFSNKSDNDDSNSERVELKKEVGLIGGLSLVVGTMIGSGIFLSPAGILREAQSVGASLCIWAGCGLLATLGALCYLELGLMIQKSGGAYIYLREAYGNVIGYLVVWTTVVVTGPSASAILAVGFAEYATTPFYPHCTPPATVQKCAAAFSILIIVSINCFSVKLANAIQIFFTAAKLLIIAAIIVGGFVMLGQGKTENFNNAFEGSATSFSAIAVAFYSGLWSYDGWNQLNSVTAEVKNPVKNFPLVVMIGIPLVTVLYILVNIAYFTVMTPAEMMQSNAVAVTFGDRVFGPASFLVPIFVVFSTFGSANGTVFSTGRVGYAAGKNGHMVRLLSYVSVTRLTPAPALTLQGTIAVIMIIPNTSTFSSLIDYFTFATWIFHGFTFLSVLVLRYQKPNWKRPYRYKEMEDIIGKIHTELVWLMNQNNLFGISKILQVFLPIPVICFLASLYLIVAPILEDPAIEYLYAAIFILAGLTFYIPFVHFKIVPTFMGPLTIYLQELLEVVPPPEDELMLDGEVEEELEKSHAF